MLTLLIIVYLIAVIFNKNNTMIIKRKVFYKRAKDVKNFYLSISLVLNIFTAKNNEFSSYKKLQEVDHILSCVKYNSPTMYHITPDYELLKKYNLSNKPIFVVSSLTSFDIDCLFVARKIYDFNIVIPSKLIIDKNKITFNYFEINSETNIKLINNIMLLNINKNNYFKIINPVKIKGLSVFCNNKQLFFHTKIINNKLNLFYCDNYIKINIEKINYNGETYKVLIQNNCIYARSFCVKYEQLLSSNICQYIKKSHGLKVKTNRAEYNFVSDRKFDISYTKVDKDIITMPHIKAVKKLVVKASQSQSFLLHFGECESYKNLGDFVDSYKSILTNLFNAKIECLDKKISFMFNHYLPQQIANCDMLGAVCNFDCYEDAYLYYRQNKISAYMFYVWLKEKFFGIIENENCIFFNPICKFDFVVDIDGTKINIKKANNDQRYLEINNVKYYNYFILPKNKLKANNCFTLVI